MWIFFKIFITFNIVVIAILFLGKGPEVESIFVFNFYFFFVSALFAPFVSNAVESWVEKCAQIVGPVFREPFAVWVSIAGWYVISYGSLVLAYRAGLDFLTE